MSYHGLGAGPGPTRVYRVDLPLPWGDDTPIRVPLQKIVDDAYAASEAHIEEMANEFISANTSALNAVLDRAIQEGTVLVERISWGPVLAVGGGALAIGSVLGFWFGRRR